MGGERSERGYRRWQAYNASKLANALFTLELDRRLLSLALIVDTSEPMSTFYRLNILEPVLQFLARLPDVDLAVICVPAAGVYDAARDAYDLLGIREGQRQAATADHGVEWRTRRALVREHFGKSSLHLRKIREYIFHRVQVTVGFAFLLSGFTLQLFGRYRPLPPGETGSIAVRAPDPVMFLEYWRNPDATRAKFRGDFLMTGDQGTMDDDGYLRFVGRDDDVITSAGYRIGPGEVEDCLGGHPAVKLAAVVGKPDALRTEIVKAFIVLNRGFEPSDALAGEIRSYVRTRLAAHEYPREIAFADELPLTRAARHGEKIENEKLNLKLPDGRLLILHRRLSWLSGISAKLSIAPAKQNGSWTASRPARLRCWARLGAN